MKNSAPQLHAIVSTWSSCTELPVQKIFLRIAIDLVLNINGRDATDAYLHSPAADIDTYLMVDDT